MSESALERLRWKTREKEVERKGEAFRMEQIEKERTKHVWLTGMIYVEPVASHAPTTKELKILNKNRKVGSWKKN